jgi:hypothetical protein
MFLVLKCSEERRTNVIYVKFDFLVYLTLISTLIACSFRQTNTNKGEKMNYLEAKNLVAAYAEYQKIPMSDVFEINTIDRFRGSVYNIEFEYNSDNKILISRGYIFQSKFYNLRPDVWNKFVDIENDPLSSETIKILNGKKVNFLNRKFELDSTIKEISSENLYRLNLRMDFTDNSITEKDFIKEMKSLAEDSYLWDKSYYVKVVEHCNITFFPEKAKSYINSYVESKKMQSNILFENDDFFSKKINDLQLKFEKKSQMLLVTLEIPKIKDVYNELNYYNGKIKADSLWYWRADISVDHDRILLNIKIGNYSKTDNEVIEIIDRCVNNLKFWKEEMEKKY